MVLRVARWVPGRVFGYQSLTDGPDSVAKRRHQPLRRCSTSVVEHPHLRCLVIVVLVQELFDPPLVWGVPCPDFVSFWLVNLALYNSYKESRLFVK